ncbi:transglutaminase-like domain-containing protein [Gryllotalpicola ginsengisoli]|uniref:transglutaminase-like domain-containing protein n=1 Tax=Gryllotalpicola ginsengisoli TaxID=444608 RepID=UPI0003B6483E|nr:transglutaminase-like domain-containing protein [Gryllotalpicola ginsengisoli]
MTAPRSFWTDLGVVAALSAIAALGFQPLYGGIVFVLPALGGLLVSLAAAAAGRLLRAPLITTIAFGIAGYFLFGSAFAMPATATFTVLPNLDTLSGLVRGAVFGWSDAVTLTAPLQEPPYIGVVAYVACWAAALISGAVVAHWAPSAGPGSPLRRCVAVAAPLALLIATILLGTHQVFLGGVRGVVFTALALVWICWRQSADEASVSAGQSGSRRKLIGSATVVLGALLVGGLVGGLVQPAAADRFVARDEIVPPFDPLDYPSPLAAFRKYVNDENKTVLFTESGLPKGSYVRLATMDAWDGVVWNVSADASTASGSGAFRLLGRKLPEPSLFTAGATTKATFTIKDYTGVWLPSGSYPTGLQFEGDDAEQTAQNVRVNSETGTVALTSGVTKGLSYQMEVTALKVPDEKALAAIPPATLDPADRQNVPDVVESTATQYAGDATTALQKLQNLQRSLQNLGYLSHGRPDDSVPARAGEGADRVVELLTQTPMVGDQEQYTTAFALMAGSLGFSTRVVLGAKVPSQGGDVDITGNDVTAWVEVAFQGVGWVPFFPTPTKTDAPKEQTVKPKVIPQPQVRQPPRDHLKDDQLLTPVQTEDQHKKKQQKGFEIPVWAYWAGGSLLLLAAIVFLPLLIVWLLKRRRRRKRSRGPGDRQAAGAWAELRSALAELGLAAPAQVTTRRQLARHYETAGAAIGVAVPDGSLGPLAREVDHAVFSADDVGPEAATALWASVDKVLEQARSGLSWVRRRLADYRYSRI